MGHIEFRNVKWLDGTDIEGGFEILGFSTSDWYTFEMMLEMGSVKAEADIDEYHK